MTPMSQQYDAPPAGRLAAWIAGLAVGVVLVAGTVGGVQLCGLVRGTTTCGGGGLLPLLVIAALGVALGSLILARAGASYSLATSALSVGVVAVVAMLALDDLLFDPEGALVVLAVTVLAFPACHWVTNEAVGVEDR